MEDLSKNNKLYVGLISFVEEAIPGLDFFPSFTLTWCYVYLLKRDKSI